MANPCEIIEDYTNVAGTFLATIITSLAVSTGVADTYVPTPAALMTDTLAVTDTYTPKPYTVLADVTNVGGAYTPVTHANATLQQNTRIKSVFLDSVAGHDWNDLLTVTDEYTFSNGTAYSDITKTKGEFYPSVSTTLRVTTGTLGQFFTGRTEVMEDTTGSSCTLYPSSRARELLADVTSVTDQYTAGVTRTETISDVTHVNGAYTIVVHASAVMYDETVYDGYPVIENGNLGWVAPTDTLAMSTWTDLDFTSLAEVGGRILVTTPEGIAVLVPGEEQIGSLIETGLSDFKKPSQKRIQDAYMAYTSEQPMQLDVGVTQDNGGEVTYSYQAPARTNSAMNANRVVTGRGLRSRFWRFGIRNVDGADFVLSDALVVINETSRRI